MDLKWNGNQMNEWKEYRMEWIKNLMIPPHTKFEYILVTTYQLNSMFYQLFKVGHMYRDISSFRVMGKIEQ